MKRQVIDWEEMFAETILDKGFIAKIHEKLLKIQQF